MSATKEHFHNEIEAGMKSTTPATGSKKSGGTSFPSLQGGECESQCDGRGGSASTRQPKASSRHKIQWLNLPGYKGETWNPLLGCKKVSDGCKNCYAEKMAARVYHCTRNANTFTHLEYSTVLGRDLKWNGESSFVIDRLYEPMRWKAPRVIFVCSMGDLFFEKHTFEQISSVFSVMADCERHIYIVLTKRPERMLEFYNWISDVHGVPWQPSNNVWMGVTAENQEQANYRMVFLNGIYAAVKFVSIEPMLSPVDLNDALQHSLKYHTGGLKNCLSWVICGGESGHNARPVHPDWVRSIRNQCEASGVPFFFKQWGEWKPMGTIGDFQMLPFGKYDPSSKFGFLRKGKHKSGNTLDGKKYEQYPATTPAIDSKKSVSTGFPSFAKEGSGLYREMERSGSASTRQPKASSRNFKH